MNDKDDKTDFGQLKSEQQYSPGQLLKYAREQRKLSHIDVARELKLRVQWIVDIENDDYKDAAALIYVRGYLKSYAKLVNLSEEDVLNAFSAMDFQQQFAEKESQASSRHEEQFVKNQPVLSYSRAEKKTGAGKKALTWFWIIVVLVIIAYVGYYVYRHKVATATDRPKLVIPEQTQTATEVNDAKQPTMMVKPNEKKN